AVGIVVLWRHRGPPSRFFLHWLAWTAAFWAVLYLAWQPFHAAYEAPLDGIRVSEWRTVLWHYLQIHALLLFLTGSWLVYQFRDRFFPPGTLRVGGRHVLAIAVGIGVFALVWFSVPVLRQWTTVLMLAGFLFMAGTMLLWWLLRRSGREAPQQAFLLCMVIVAFGIGAGVDFVTLGNDIDRMNTVFKLYLNAWVLFGIVGGVGLWQLWAAGALRGGRLPKVWLSVLAVLVLASSVFLVWGTHARVSDRFDPTLPLTLDGMVYQQASVYQDPGPANGGGMAYALHHDAEALEFMRRNIEGSPVVLEGVTPFYRWTPRVAKYTGLPVVVGYEWHQIQQRGVNGGENVRQRTWEVQSAYDSTDAGALWDVVDRYGVEYIYVGPAERLYFAQEGIAKFEDFVGEGLEVFFSNDEVRVYRVTGGG
ncbi:MAG: DUF2298 domain-containing protein, partial [Dehalococcoidia bacterium]